MNIKLKKQLQIRISSNFMAIIYAFIDLGAAIVTIITLGFYSPSWDMMFVSWNAIRRIKKRKGLKGKVDFDTLLNKKIQE